MAAVEEEEAAVGWEESSAAPGNPCSSSNSSLAVPSLYPFPLLRNRSSSRACSKISPVQVATVVAEGAATDPPGSEAGAMVLGPDHQDLVVRYITLFLV